ncbi:AAA family ATPase [Streptomyces sp. NPDC059837]|uniref:AAA family ATPase n=1 Tax=Streptomyces sp. NPDC059837 TaxID=3346968 RepID=UPI00365B2669
MSSYESAAGRPVSEHEVYRFSERFSALVSNVEQVIVGKRHVVEQSLICLLAQGHLLIEDRPGVGKTSLARAVAASFGGVFRRIQFTSDLLPSDVIGTTQLPSSSISELAGADHTAFPFVKGPIFANVVLCDEINRASPKTQSALLEIMQERQVTVAGQKYDAEKPFMAVATQNPLDFDGTYPLPEAQLDRFLMRVSIGYPSPEAELHLLRSEHVALPPDKLSSVCELSEFTSLVATAQKILVVDAVHRYILDLVQGTRTHPNVRIGASPRAGLALLRACRVRAGSRQRHYVDIEDVQALATPVLAHRLLLTDDAELDRISPDGIVQEIIKRARTPR